MSKPMLPSASNEMSISSLLAGEPVGPSTLHSKTLSEGIDVLVWEGKFAQALSMKVRDDWGRVQFSCALRGRSQYVLPCGGGRREYLLNEGMSCMSYLPGCCGHFTHTGTIESVTVAVRPELLPELVPDMDLGLARQLDSAQCYTLARSDAQMNAVAYSLAGAMYGRQPGGAQGKPRSSLWLFGQSMVLVSLIIAAQQQDANPGMYLSLADKQKLMRARDCLLADLSEAPTIAMLAKETGLGVLKLKRGFRVLFQQSVYGLFQQERMHEAMRRLALGNSSVMVVASDMGYVNASHFAVAFQKQFGVKPSSLKQRR